MPVSGSHQLLCVVASAPGAPVCAPTSGFPSRAVRTPVGVVGSEEYGGRSCRAFEGGWLVPRPWLEVVEVDHLYVQALRGLGRCLRRGRGGGRGRCGCARGARRLAAAEYARPDGADA